MFFRLHPAATHNSRAGATTTDKTSGIFGVGVFGSAYFGKSATASAKDGGMVNCFIQTVMQLGKKVLYCVKRPGWQPHTTPAPGQYGHAILVWSGYGNGDKVISAFDNPSVIYDGTTSLGAITGICTSLTETTVGVNIDSLVPTIVTSSTDNTAWYYGAGVVVMTQITDADFPSNQTPAKSLAGGFVHMDGFSAIMTTDGRLWASNLNTLTGWTENSFGSADAYPDKGIGAVRHKGMIMAFGTESIQFFYNAGLTPFPFAKAVAMTLKIGAVNANAITSISDSVFFAGSTPQGGLSVFQWDGALNRISTPEIDTMLILNGSSGITLTSLRFYGRSFILVNTGNYTFAYCIEEKLWHEWGGLNKLWYKCVGASVGASLLNYCISNTVAGGKVYKMDTADFVYLDDGLKILSKINLPNEDMGTSRKKVIHEIELIADIESSFSPVTIAITWDDFNSFTSLGTVNLKTDRPRLTRCGAGRKFGLQLTHAANTPFRLEAIQGRYDMGT